MVICLYLGILLTLLNHDMCYTDGKAKAKIGTVVFPARAEHQQKPSGNTSKPWCPAVSTGNPAWENYSHKARRIQSLWGDHRSIPLDLQPPVPLDGAGGTDRPRPRCAEGTERGREGGSIPRTPPWLRLPKCFLRNACLMITGSLSYILGRHGPKVGKHHEQAHLSARRRDGESPGVRNNKLPSCFFRPCLQQQSSF